MIDRVTQALLLAALAAAAPVRAGQRLVLIGGGAKPPQANARFMEWAGGEKARVLVVTWATADPEGSFAGIRDTMLPLHPASVEHAPAASEAAWKERFLSQLSSATGVYFSGGDQNRVTDVLKDAAVAQALRARYAAGVVFGGTSAGTAIMSKIMLTGEGDFSVLDGAKVETKEGLGLLPPDIIVDQHFIKERRENRLFSLILSHPGCLGLGVDEGTALAVEDNRYAQVIGPTQVMVVETSPRHQLEIDILRGGDRYDLKERKRL